MFDLIASLNNSSLMVTVNEEAGKSGRQKQLDTITIDDDNHDDDDDDDK